MNYFDVLELSIDDIQGKDEATIKTLVNAAHKKLYALTVGAYANIPRPDGKTQAQWQQILNDAKATLIDPQQRQAHIAELTGNRRDEFINFINTLKTTSPTITPEQYNGLLQQAQNEYGLTPDEAENVLRNSGLIIRASDTQQDTPVVSDPIDEFTAFLAAVKATSPKITVSQSKGFLKRAIQDYGLTDAEAKRVLADSGLVIEKNTRSVLKMSIAAVLVALLGVGGIVIYSEWMDERERLAQEQIETQRREQAALETMKARFTEEKARFTEERDKFIDKVGFRGATDVHVAAGLNLTLLTKSLLDNGADANASDSGERTPLHYTALENAAEAAVVLLKNGAHVDLAASDRHIVNGYTPLYYAVSHNAAKTVEVLLKNGADVGNDRFGYMGPPLHWAARSNAAETAAVLLENGANVDVSEEEYTGGKTPLHRAAWYNAALTAEVLLKNGADVNAEGPGKTPLHYAAEHNARETAEVLLKNGSDVNARDKYDRRTPLHYAAEHNADEIARLFLNYGASVNMKDKEDFTPLYVAMKSDAHETATTLLNVYPATPLHFAATNNDSKTVEILLKNGTDVNTKNEADFTPLHYAVRANAPAIVEILIKNSANVNAKNVYGGTPLHEAARNNADTIAEFLVIHDADVDAKNDFGKTPLYNAVLNNALETVKILLNYDADVNVKDDSGDILLHKTARKNANKIADLLLKNGTPANAKNKYGDTPLHEAARKNAVETAKVLLKNGAYINVKNKYGDTPLHEAVGENANEVVEFLLKNGAYINAKDNRDNIPLHSALQWMSSNINGGMLVHSEAYESGTEIVEILLKNGADINAKNYDGITPLHYAAGAEAYEAAEVLLKNGANVNAKDNRDNTPLHFINYPDYGMYSLRRAHKTIDLLRRHGGKK